MTRHRTVSVDGLDIFYREAGSRDNPTILLLHGYPTSSHMFRNLMPALANQFHLVAPDYPGFGYSSMPTVDEFDYTFDRLTKVIAGLIDAICASLRLASLSQTVSLNFSDHRPQLVRCLINAIRNGSLI